MKIVIYNQFISSIEDIAYAKYKEVKSNPFRFTKLLVETIKDIYPDIYSLLCKHPEFSERISETLLYDIIKGVFIQEFNGWYRVHFLTEEGKPFNGLSRIDVINNTCETIGYECPIIACNIISKRIYPIYLKK